MINVTSNCYYEYIMVIATKVLLNSLSIYILSLLIDAVVVTDYVTALLAALLLGVLNVTIKPIVKLLTFPINFLTLGLFGLVINGAAIYAVAYLIEGFGIINFWWAVLAALLIAFITNILEAVVGVAD